MAATLVAVAALAAVPARIGARRPVTEILQAELAWDRGIVLIDGIHLRPSRRDPRTGRVV